MIYDPINRMLKRKKKFKHGNQRVHNAETPRTELTKNKQLKRLESKDAIHSFPCSVLQARYTAVTKILQKEDRKKTILCTEKKKILI